MTPASTVRRSRAARRRWRFAPAAVLALALAAPAVAATPDGSPSPEPSVGASASPSASASPAPSASPSASPAPPATAPASASPEPSVAAPSPDPGSPAPSALPARQGTLPAQGGPVEPGTYEDWSLGPTLTFTVPEGWAATPFDAGFGLALVWAASPVPAVLTFTEFDGLVFEDPCLATTDATIPIEKTPDALAMDLAQSPYLVVAEPIETEVAGYPALQLEVATQQPMGCDPPETWTWAAEGGGGFVLSDGQQATFLLFNVGERMLVVSYETFPGADFESFAAAAMTIIETLEIDPSTDPGPSPAVTVG